jgi:hypothetical protein
MASENRSVWTNVLPHAEELYRLISVNVPQGTFDVSPAANIHIIGMLWRALRLYDGVLVLLKAELPEEAMILARSLFEVSLRLKQLEAEPDDRYPLVLGWINDSIQQQVGLLEVGKASGLDSDIDDALARLRQSKEQIRQYASTLGVTRYQRFFKVKEAASRYGRKEDFWSYEWAHESVHSSDSVWMFARRRPTEDSVNLYAKTGNSFLLSGFAHFAAQSMIDSAKAVFTIVGWDLPANAVKEVTEIERILDSDGG